MVFFEENFVLSELFFFVDIWVGIGWDFCVVFLSSAINFNVRFLFVPHFLRLSELYCCLVLALDLLVIMRSGIWGNGAIGVICSPKFFPRAVPPYRKKGTSLPI